MLARVKGGTGAGRKRPLKQATTWTCSCPAHEFGKAPAALFANREHPSWRGRCEDCGTSKP